MRQPPVFRNRGCERDPVGRNVFCARGQHGVAVTWIPVHGDVNRDRHAFEGEIVNADVFGESPARVRRFEQNPRWYAFERGNVVGLDVAESA